MGERDGWSWFVQTLYYLCVAIHRPLSECLVFMVMCYLEGQGRLHDHSELATISKKLNKPPQ